MTPADINFHGRQLADLARSRVAALGHVAAPPRQGHPHRRGRGARRRGGVEGIVVSNHGGRQLDGAPASLDALPEIVEAAGDQARGAARQRHPPRGRRRQGARTRRARGARGPRGALRASRSEAPTVSNGCSACCARRSSSLLRSAAAPRPPRSRATTSLARSRVTGAVRAGGIRAADRRAVGRGPRRATAIRAIVADADAAFDPDALWPADEWDVWEATPPMKNLYVGAAGVVWALDALAQARPRRDDARPRLGRAAHPRSLAREARLRAMGRRPLASARRRSSCGESGPLLAVAWRLDPSAELADRAARARARERRRTRRSRSCGARPGRCSPRGRCSTGRARSAGPTPGGRAPRRSGARREPDGLWTKPALRRDVPRPRPAARPRRQRPGAARRRRAARPGPARDARTGDGGDPRTHRGREDGLANWPTRGADCSQADGEIRLQWCAGAPGIVASAASYLDEELLLAGAELTWHAGPPGMEKGPASATGRPGTATRSSRPSSAPGRALARPRPPVRRARARAGRARRRRGHGRYSLWTGDVGAALYAADCLEARTAYPVLDSWD